jgi:excinuclease UvrABC nuclease subunit
MTEAPSLTAVYRHFDATGRLLYVGSTGDPEARWKQHQRQSGWVMAGLVDSITVEWWPSRAEARAAERVAIRAENPVYNRLRPKVGGPAPTLGQLFRRAKRAAR